MTILSECEPNHFNCWAEIDLDALAHNVQCLRSVKSEIMAVLKADAYGHGVAVIAPALKADGIKHFGVATASEGCVIRQLVGTDSSIYVMTSCAPEDLALIVEHSLIPFISSIESLQALSTVAKQSSRTVAVHIEIDTGIGRAGVNIDSFPSFLQTALKLNNIKVTGICTHFTSGEDKEDASRQFTLFEKCIEQIPDQLRTQLTVHAANSPASINLTHSHLDLIRPGLLLYGISPVPEIIPTSPYGQTLQPVMSLKSKVILIRTLPAETPISYGRTYILPKPSRIATIGIGYGDGYSRRFSNIGNVILPSGALAPIRGRVCMDQLCIEAPENEALSVGDTVTLLGAHNGTQMLAADLAGLIDATPHEITTCITSRVPRICRTSVPLVK